MPLLDLSSPACHLGLAEMDETHREFAELVNTLAEAKGKAFEGLFNQLCDHTQQHFQNEKELMLQSPFPAFAEHEAEHQRILGELAQYRRRVNKGAIPFARAYVTERLPEWFHLHLATMDSALAFHLKGQVAVG